MEEEEEKGTKGEVEENPKEEETETGEDQSEHVELKDEEE